MSVSLVHNSWNARSEHASKSLFPDSAKDQEWPKNVKRTKEASGENPSRGGKKKRQLNIHFPPTFKSEISLLAHVGCARWHHWSPCLQVLEAIWSLTRELLLDLGCITPANALGLTETEEETGNEGGGFGGGTGCEREGNDSCFWRTVACAKYSEVNIWYILEITK